MKKIYDEIIDNCHVNIFGEWLNNNLKIETNPFEHIIFTDFIDKDYYNKLQEILPKSQQMNGMITVIIPKPYL
jgi:hypothetical protein